MERKGEGDGLGHCHPPPPSSFLALRGSQFRSVRNQRTPRSRDGKVDFERAQVSRWTGLKRFRTARVFFASQPNTFHFVIVSGEEKGATWGRIML
jgi:hypothetical protein